MDRGQITARLTEMIDADTAGTAVGALDNYWITAVTIYDGSEYWTINHYAESGPYSLTKEDW
jgi:hypothetical protein